MVIGGSCLSTGNHEESIRALETLSQLGGRMPAAIGYPGAGYAFAGRTGEAMKLIEELPELNQRIYVQGSSFAHIYAGLGEIDKALD